MLVDKYNVRVNMVSFIKSITKRYFSNGVDLCRYLYNTLVISKPSKKEIVDTVKHSIDVIRTGPANYKEYKTEKEDLKKLDERLKKDYPNQRNGASWIGRLVGVSDLVSPAIMSTVAHLPILAAAGLIYFSQFLTRGYLTIASKQITDIKSAVRLAEKSKYTNAYIQSQSGDANRIKEQSPKVAEAVASYMSKDVDIKRAKTSLYFNAAFLTVLNPISGLLVGGISLYNWVTSLYNLRNRKKYQSASIKANNQYGMIIDQMIDAAPVLRETNNIDYANERIKQSQSKALEKDKEFSENNMKLNMKNVPFRALVSATMWSASLIAGASAGSGFEAAAVFAAAMMASERVLMSASSLLEHQAEKMDLYRMYKENMKGLEYEYQNVRTGEKTLETSNGHLQILDMTYLYTNGKGVKDISLDFSKARYLLHSNSSKLVYSSERVKMGGVSSFPSLDDAQMSLTTADAVGPAPAPRP